MRQPIPPHLEGLVLTKAGNAWICVHNRQLSICAQCAPEADKRYKETKPKVKRKKAKDATVWPR